MNQSLFIFYLQRFFHEIVGKVTETYNGSNTESPFLHKTMLTEEYSADLTWGASNLNHSIVAADVVSLESSLPLKSRGSIATASGTIPKIGVKYRKGEKLILDINIMKARGQSDAQIAAKVLEDVPVSIKSVEIRKEIMFLEGLSTGATLVKGEENVGTGIRVSFGYKTDNEFIAEKKWGDSGYTPIDDIRKMFDKADEDGNTITHVYLSKQYFNLARTSEQAKSLVAQFLNNIVVDLSKVATPSKSVFLEALEDEFGAEFHIVDSKFRIEKLDGTFETIVPWAQGNIVGLYSNVCGRLVYGTLAEETNPVANVTYEKSGSHTLVAKFSKTDPLEEFTTAQALAIPVIDNASAIYVLHADEDVDSNLG